jgi:hypothetical protein
MRLTGDSRGHGTRATAVVNFRRDNGLLLAIRGGGHNGPGLASIDDGLVIDHQTGLR